MAWGAMPARDGADLAAICLLASATIDQVYQYDHETP